MSNQKSIGEYLSLINSALEKETLDPKDFLELQSWLDGLRERETRRAGRTDFREYLRLDFLEELKAAGITSGKVAEIGGPFNSFESQMTDYDFEFISLYPVEDHNNVIVADIGQADYLESEQYDAIFSVSVLEHVAKPWDAATHMTRLLKPGGIVYHAAPFSYFYHGAPADFWRFTPDAFETLFLELRTRKAEFFGENRRRDNRGSKFNPVDRDGGEKFSIDAFGGWRENWYTIYCGQKDQEHLENKLAYAKAQTAVNLIKIKIDQGKELEDAIADVVSINKTLRVTPDQELSVVDEAESNFNLSADEIATYWRKRLSNGEKVRPSYNRFVMAKKVGFI